MKNIKIVALEGCRMCRELLDGLKKSSAAYSVIDADSNGAFCDKLETFLGITNYPIAIVEDNRYVYYYYIAQDYNNSQVKELSNNSLSRGCYSIAEMLHLILN